MGPKVCFIALIFQLSPLSSTVAHNPREDNVGEKVKNELEDVKSKGLSDSVLKSVNQPILFGRNFKQIKDEPYHDHSIHGHQTTGKVTQHAIGKKSKRLQAKVAHPCQVPTSTLSTTRANASLATTTWPRTTSSTGKPSPPACKVLEQHLDEVYALKPHAFEILPGIASLENCQNECRKQAATCLGITFNRRFDQCIIYKAINEPMTPFEHVVTQRLCCGDNCPEGTSTSLPTESPETCEIIEEFRNKVFEFKPSSYTLVRDVSSLEDCQTRCKNLNPPCFGITFVRNFKQCVLYKEIRLPLRKFQNAITQRLCCNGICDVSSATTTIQQPCPTDADCQVKTTENEVAFRGRRDRLKPVRDLLACRIQCHQNQGCIGITYFSRPKACEVFYKINRSKEIRGAISQTLDCPCNKVVEK